MTTAQLILYIVVLVPAFVLLVDHFAGPFWSLWGLIHISANIAAVGGTIIFCAGVVLGYF